MLGRLHRRRRSVSHNEDGVAVVEFAFAMPILVMFIWGISQFGMIMAADAGIQNALGEGARVATLFPTPDSTTINQRMTDSLFGQFLGSYAVTNSGVTDITQSTTSGGVTTTKVVGKCIDLNITYTVTPNFLFFNGPVITMPRSKRVYIST